jgi:hypothetical protein
MRPEPDERPFRESDLDSPEYRERLMRKLNTLIAVLEVADAKVRRSLAGPAPDVARLERIRRNLRDTLQICLRAKAVLEKRGSLPQGLSKDLARAVNPDLVDASRLAAPGAEPPAEQPQPGRGREVELSLSEARKFTRLGPIRARELSAVDLDELARRLQGP